MRELSQTLYFTRLGDHLSRMPDLLSLPNELLRRILEFTHPGSLVLFALANREVYANPLQALEMHRDRLPSLRIVHDRNPINVPTALRNVIAEPKLAWYTHSLEVWELRQNFSSWKSPTFFMGNPAEDLDSEEHLNWPEKHYDYSYLGLSYYDDELRQYRSLLVHTLQLSEAMVELWMKRLESGCDEPLKVLFMALLPRLSKVTFVQYDSWPFRDSAEIHQLRLLSASLRRLALLPAPQWPCFRSITEATVGHQHDLQHPHDNYYPTSHTIAPLLLLPRIQKLNLHLMQHDDHDADSDTEDKHDRPYVWEWKPYISTCQDLQFYACSLALKTMKSLLGGMKALQSFNCVHGCPSQKKVLSLLKNAKSSLVNLRLEENSEPCDMGKLKGFDTLHRLDVIDRLLIDQKAFKETQVVFDDAGYLVLDRCTFGITD